MCEAAQWIAWRRKHTIFSGLFQQGSRTKDNDSDDIANFAGSGGRYGEPLWRPEAD
jgi:hypothetical protein